MGAEVLAASMIGLGIAQGAASMSSRFSQAEKYREDANLLESENYREAARIEDDAKRFADEQKLMYIGSGVEIGGSAVVTLAQTDKWARTEAEAVRSRGRALKQYGYDTAKKTQREGIASFIQGIGRGVGSGYSIYNYAKAGVGS